MASHTGVVGTRVFIIALYRGGGTSAVDAHVVGAIVSVIAIDGCAGTAIGTTLIVVGANISVITRVGVEIVDSVAVEAAIVGAFVSIATGKREVVAGFFNTKIVGACVVVAASTVVGTGETVLCSQALPVATAFGSAICGTATTAFSLGTTTIPTDGPTVEFAGTGIFRAGTDAIATARTL